MANAKLYFDVPFEYKLIYVFEIRDEQHKGLLKVGDTTIKSTSPDKLAPGCRELNLAAKERIDSYTRTAGVNYELLYTELATRVEKDKQGNECLRAFRDHDVHAVLKNSGVKQKKLNNSNEWFKADLHTVKCAIEAVKQGKKNLSGAPLEFEPIIFRPEQADAIDRTITRFRTGDRMLWNAKMRFGKTVSALEVIRRCGFKKTIIITHRPVVDKGWYEDFALIFHNNPEYTYGSKNTGYASYSDLQTQGEHLIWFASMQDLRDSKVVDGQYDKNTDVFNEDWDFVIVDEAHEGTTTALGDKVIKNIVKEGNDYPTKFLALSGTPFNVLRDYDTNSIYTWDYVMEQRNKAEWALKHMGDYNPYDELPELNIFTYDLGKIIRGDNYQEVEDKAFNFREFFRVWTGDKKVDGVVMPADVNVGDFVHEQDVKSFLNLMTREDEDSAYPYSNPEYRELFKHTLWMVPGVKEAKALSALLNAHPVFGSGVFKVVNVAGDGDEEEKSEEALRKVQNAITENSAPGLYTITLSCGRLTTGVTVKEWTGVFMLAGSFSTSAANYLQTIFRVQSPCNIDGKIKKRCYVFDFAPDRTLKMVAEAVAISTRAGGTNDSDRNILGDFLNFCPVISIDGSQMKQYDTNKLLQQLKKAYAERAIQNGFDDNSLYALNFNLDEEAIADLQELKRQIGTSQAAPKTKEIDVNKQGLTDEQYETVAKIERKPKRERTPEEEELLEKAREARKARTNAISILRGVSIRMPLLIYGADVAITEDITIEGLVDLIDDESWKEFMPTGVTKDLFRKFIKLYDPEVFVSAGRKIREMVKAADDKLPTERVKQIAHIFSFFKNPDKETVLTPWRVVNMHMGDCLGGYDFFEDSGHKKPIDEQTEPHFRDQGDVTAATLGNKHAKILEINSKTGLYPLYVTYSIFRSKCADYTEEQLTPELQQKLWNETVKENVFVICKTKMAKHITQRTLSGFGDTKINAHAFDDLINQLENKPKQFVERVPRLWKDKKGNEMKFDAVASNPPYQISDGGAQASAKPLYHLFVQQAKEIKPKYISMIIPSRWFAGGKGLDDFRASMLNDKSVRKLVDMPISSECFPNVEIKGGVCYFLWDRDNQGTCQTITVQGDDVSVADRYLLEEGANIFIRHNQAISILRKVQAHKEPSFADRVSASKPFGLRTFVKGNKNQVPGYVKLYENGGSSWIDPETIKINREQIGKYKVYVSKAYGAGEGFPHQIINKPFVGEPGSCCTETYLSIGAFDDKAQAENVAAYMKTKFFRFMVMLAKNTQDATRKVYVFVPDQAFERRWTDEMLYEKYKLTKEEISFIESMIKPLD
ncbi:MAG: Eco57I restriction-modification methylase domain-containing protein [Alphaproteobacteria bacterium]|nr:Eco57I restriction-modification methylase domain-containing protein [Alphaproteobacteria bacterium]